MKKTLRCLQHVPGNINILNAFVTLPPEGNVLKSYPASQVHGNAPGKNSDLRGRAIAIKDNICTKDMTTTCSSGMLRDFKPEYDATVVQLLKEEGALILGKSNMDEFGMGSQSTFSYFGPVKHPLSTGSLAYTAGGSSGGSAAAVAANVCFGALGSDTGGSVRLPGSYCGVVGFKPSYGLLSRRGLIAYAHSLDTVGILARDVSSTRLIYGALNKCDSSDPTSMSISTREKIGVKAAAYRSSRGGASRRWRIGIPMDYNISDLSDELKEAWVRTLAIMKDLGHELVPVSLPSTPYALLSYYIIAPAEASSNLAKYDGVRFGFHPRSEEKRDAGSIPSTAEEFAKARGQGLGSEVRRRILLGNYSLSSESMENYFIQAQRVRRIVKQDFDKVFAFSNPLEPEPKNQVFEGGQSCVDALLSPTSVSTAPVLSDTNKAKLDDYINDVFTVPASMAGLPAMSIPVYTEYDLPLGLQIVTQYGDEESLFDIATLVENL